MQLDQLKRRDFITLLGGAAVAWPRGARAAAGERGKHPVLRIEKSQTSSKTGVGYDNRGYFEAERL
jgi:hypothetical protein